MFIHEFLNTTYINELIETSHLFFTNQLFFTSGDLGFSIDYNYGFDVTNQQDGHPYRCHLCGKCYMHKGNMRRHMRFECGKPPHLKCDHCSYRTHHKHHLIRHRKNSCPKK